MQVEQREHLQGIYKPATNPGVSGIVKYQVRLQFFSWFLHILKYAY